MKKRVFFIVAIVSSLFFTSCKEKCRDGDETAFGYLPQMESYFGMYKPGNWWVYKNQDSTKTDSIFITDFIEQTKRDKTECISFPERRFKLHNSFLSDGGYYNIRYFNNSGCCINFISFINSNSSYLSELDFTMDSNNGINHPYPNINLIDSLKIGNITFYGLANQTSAQTNREIYIAPNIGIVKYTNASDTFSLKTYYIQ